MKKMFLTISAMLFATAAWALPNPASEYCVNRQGGELQIHKDKDGSEAGFCHLPDGRVVEEWELFRGQEQGRGEPIMAGTANPAAKFCEERGGKSEIRKDKKGGERGVCRLKNGKVVDEWKYYRRYITANIKDSK